MKYSRGFTLVSLMVASAIGIFVAGVAGKVYVDSKVAFQMRSAVAAANENGRFAVEDLRRTLVMAGRGISSGDDSPAVYTVSDNGLRTFPAVGSDGAIGTGVIVNRDSTDADATVGSSVIAIRYAEGPSCGGTVSTNTTVRFFVNTNSELVCEITDATGTTTQPIVSGIEQMRALYGVDDDADGLANRFLTATAVEAASPTLWPNVVAIRVGLIAGSAEFEVPSSYRASTLTAFNLLGMTTVVPSASNHFKSVTTTISLRNLNTVVERQ